METIDSLGVVSLDSEGHAKTCDYWYLVQNHAFSHTAFNRCASFLQWLEERGLKLTAELPEHGTFSGWIRIEGSYRQQYHNSYDEFYALQGYRTRTLSNGDYTLAIITNDADGIKTVHTLNPNCHDRTVYDYRESRAMVG